MRRSHTILMSLAFGVVLSACDENPTFPGGVHDDLTVAVSFSPEHLTTLTDLQVEVQISDHNGAPVQDFESVAVELRAEGDVDWRGVDLLAHGDHFSASHRFYSSGHYDLRVSAQAHGSDHADVIYTHPNPIEVERIHQESGHFRVEMETFPGHIHEGEESAVRFWITEDMGGSMMPVAGMQVTIEVGHTVTGGHTTHPGEEHEPGVYEIHYTFAEHGEFEVAVDFEDDHAAHHHVAFHVPVSPGH